MKTRTRNTKPQQKTIPVHRKALRRTRKNDFCARMHNLLDEVLSLPKAYQSVDARLSEKNPIWFMTVNTLLSAGRAAREINAGVLTARSSRR
jgi:hypothetical protein